MTTATHTDWRLPENRIEAFTRVAHTRAVMGDLDFHHNSWVITEEMDLDKEDKAIFCLLYGQSYRNHWAMIATQLDLYNMPHDKLVDWHNENWFRMKFGNDTKWNVRRFPPFIKSMKEVCGGSVYRYLYDAAHVGTTEENFYSLNKALREINSIGRMTAWLTMQTLYHIFKWDIDHWDQQLYDQGTWSQYDSICYLFDRMDIIRKKKDEDGKIVKYTPTKKDIAVVVEYGETLMKEVNRRVPIHLDIYGIESVECEYRKTAYGPKIKEYTFWATNEQLEQYAEFRELWDVYKGPGKVNWDPFVLGFLTKAQDLVDDYGYDKSYFKVVTDHGLNLNTHFLYKDEPDAHELLDLPKYESDGLRLMKNDWARISETRDTDDLKRRYHPLHQIVFKPKTHPGWSDNLIRTEVYSEFR
jgi:hypothetical protein